MECAEEASKPNFMSIKLTRPTQSSSDDFWSVNGDDFFIDNLLNFPTDTSFVEDNNNSYLDDSIPVNEDKTCIPETELNLPVNDLHWASQFVNDSFSGDSSLTFPVKKFRETETVTETVTLVAVNPTFKKMVNKRPRSKRNRNGGNNVWSLESSTSSSSVVSVSSFSSKVLLGAEGILGKSSAYMQKRKRAAGTSQPQPWCCNHCGVQKTPQWRAGPLGPKTLCNACGVRFKSGRLLPEYRPACSPTYSSEVHSNNHRKVLEMRRKKVEAGLAIPDHGSCI